MDETLRALIISLCRHLPAGNRAPCYDEMVERGVTDDQIRFYCSDSFVADTVGFLDENEAHTNNKGE